MSSIGARLKESREKKGLLQSELAKLIGVKSAGVISNWEQDLNKPNADKMVEICQVLGISLSYLLNYYGTEKAPSLSDEAMKLAEDYDGRMDDRGRETVRGVADLEVARFKSETAAALRKSRERSEAAEEIAPETVFFLVPGFVSAASAGLGQPAENEYAENFKLTREPPYGTSYIIRVSGDSMEPTYHHGEMVFVHAQNEIPVGKIGIFFMDGQQWIKELGNGVLISHNQAPEYAPRAMTDDVVCQGLVLGVCDDSYFE